MNSFIASSIFFVGAVIAVGVVLAPIVQTAWTARILIASYISLCLVMLMPDNLIFGVYANIIYFFSIVVIFALIESKFFDVTAWSVGRFSFESIGISVLTVFFIVAIICFLVPLKQLSFVIPVEDIYDFFNDYIFYIAIAPLIFSILFSKRLRF
ncbi:MAG: hypothetical protein U9Q12_00295 [Patescibacteria group bacterium]|nr:hypothetical protein [Patescibacteria group bacterium]